MNNNDRLPFFTTEQIRDVKNSREHIRAKVRTPLPKMLNSTASQSERRIAAGLSSTRCLRVMLIKLLKDIWMIKLFFGTLFIAWVQVTNLA